MENLPSHIVTAIYLLFATALVAISLRSLIGGFSYLAHFRDRLGRVVEARSGARVSVIVPVRGIDEGLEENVSAILSQNHPAFDVTVVVDDSEDPALSTLSRLIESGGLRVHVARKVDGQSGKISKLISAVGSLPDETRVIVFADSDARPGAGWLSSLVDALGDEGIGAATGYRWFLPSSNGIATELRASWNASVASVLGADPKGNFCWGGSTAIRREVFESLGIASRWKGALSDDYVVLRAMREAGLGIAFVPGAMTASVESCGFRELMEFTTRQMKITRVYAPGFWIPALIGASLHCVTVIWSVGLLALSQDQSPRIIAAFTLALVWGLSVGKARLRMDAMRLAMPQHAFALDRQRKWQMILWAVTPFIFLYNCVAALFSREIVWRGVRYRMISPTETEVL
jgi:ceramide glucosyltransferase